MLPEQRQLKTLPTFYLQVRLGNFVKANGHLPGLSAEQEPRAKQRKEQ